jgi:hypothetical protein
MKEGQSQERMRERAAARECEGRSDEGGQEKERMNEKEKE